MTEGKEKKRKVVSDSMPPQRTENITSGQWLRQVREQKKLSLEDVSAAIHVRAAQLRAIEEDEIEKLPGMTYAIGFVKSYASYLKLNPVEVSNKFKSEHGAMNPVMPEMMAPTPIVESRMPDPVLVGIGAFLALIVLLGWTFFSGGDDEVEIAETPAVIAPVGEDPALFADEEKEDAEEASETAAVEEEKEPVVTETAAAAVADQAATDEPVAQVDATEEVLPVQKPDEAELAAAASEETTAAEEEIEIRRAGRVVIKAQQPSWVQVIDANEKTVYKKLMKKGEQFSVPEGRGYSLITTNAGGFDVMIDGKTVQKLGKAGEIMRGVSLNPEELQKIRRAKSRINN